MEKKTNSTLNFLIFLFMVAIIAMILMVGHIVTLHNQLRLKEAEWKALRNVLDLAQDNYLLHLDLEHSEDYEEEIEGSEEIITENNIEVEE